MSGNPRSVLAACAAVAAVLALGAEAHAAADPPPLAVTVDRTVISTELGRTFAFRSTITNDGSTAAGGLIAHLTIVSLTGDVYVDPEDWSTHRSRYLRPLAAAGAATITWRVKAVNSGRFGIAVAVLRPTGDARPPATAPLVEVAVAGRTTLNAGGILVVALGVPATLAALLAALGLRRRHSARALVPRNRRTPS